MSSPKIGLKEKEWTSKKNGVRFVVKLGVQTMSRSTPEDYKV